MHELINRYRYLLERSPFGGGACLADAQHALLWIQTSKALTSQLDRKIPLTDLRDHGERILAELVSQAYTEMLRPDTSLGPMITGESQTGETITLDTGDIVASEVALHQKTLNELGPDTVPMQRPIFEEEAPLPEPATQVLAIDPRTLRNDRATQQIQVNPRLLQQSATPAQQEATTVALARNASILIAQLNPSLSKLPRPAHIQQVDEGSVKITVAAQQGVREFSRIISIQAFEKNATHVVSEVLRAAQNRAKLTRSRDAT